MSRNKNSQKHLKFADDSFESTESIEADAVDGLDNSELALFDDVEMASMFNKEVQHWLQQNGNRLFDEAFARCINVPSRKKVQAKKSETFVKDNKNNVNTNK